jgi:hypothetical protein
MALTPSNLYAERVFSEHPLALWSFDEEHSFLSLLNTAQKDILDEEYWTLTDATIQSSTQIDNNPFPESPQARLSGPDSLSITSTDNIVIEYPNDLDPDKNSLSLSFYVYQFYNSSVESYAIEMFYEKDSVETVLDEQTFTAFDRIGWGQVIGTFTTDPDELLTIDENFTVANLRFRITVNFTDSFEVIHLIQISGMNIGQWSESFASVSQGVERLPIPSSISHLINQVSTENNLISDIDSSFEEDSTNWSAVNSVITRTDDQAYDRDNSLFVGYLNSASNPGVKYGAVDNRIEILPNEYYTISAWVKSDSGESHGVRIRVLEYALESDAEPASDNTSSSFVVDDSEWVQVFYTFTSASAANFMEFVIEEDDVFTSGEGFYVDQVLVTQSAYLRDYFKYTYTPLDSYGLDDSDNGYYLIEDNRLLSRTSGLPMVFGSNHTTKVFAPLREVNPSIILPGKGFLNESGQYRVTTLEAWLRLENISPDPIKIIGPVKNVDENGNIVENLDGLYVEEGFITMRVGDYSKSYFVGRWFRPMLLHIIYKPENISVLINGSTVIDMPIDLNNIDLAPQEFQIDGQVKNFDYIGIYGNQFVSPFEVDIVSIFPYEVNSDYAKRRLIWGQGVAEQASSNEKYSSFITSVDFANAGFSSNMIYPDINGWNSGFSSNLNSSGTMLRVPDLPLPSVQFNQAGVSEDDWLFQNYLLQEEDETFTRPTTFFRMIPTEEYAGKDPSIYFNNLSEITTSLRSVVATFKSPEFPIADQVLFRLEHRLTKNSFYAVLDENELKYYFEKPDTSPQQIGTTQTIADNSVFVAGIDTDYLTTNYYSIVSNFFSSTDLLSLNFGGYGSNTFIGRIYTLSIDSPFSFARGLTQFFGEGIIDQTYDLDFSVAILLTSWAGNYTLIPLELNSTLALDIAISGYWEDSQPLTYFGKYISSFNGSKKYDLDMIQFNVELPKPSIRKVTLFGQYSYGRLKEDWATPIQRSYADLSDVLQGGYLTYADLAAAQAEYEFEGLGVAVNTFVTIQDYRAVGKKPYTDFTNTVVPQYNNVVDLDLTTQDFETTKFQVVDGSIIIPPKDENFTEYYLTIHIDVNVRGIKSKPFALKRMELASFAFNETSPQPIGTRLGTPIYPFTRFGNTYVYKEKNPFRINKESSPYLYLTETSGVQPISIPTLFDRGLAVPINENLLPDYDLGAAQIWSKYSLSVFSNVPTKMFRITGPSNTIDFYAYADGDGKRGILRAVDAETGLPFEDLTFYQDGKYVVYPVIYPREWTAINVSFGAGLSMRSFIGTLEMYEGFSFDNIIVYKNSNTIERQSNVYELWGEIVNDTWDEVYNPGELVNTWETTVIRNVPVTFIVDSLATYNSQIGLALAVVEDESSLEFNSAGVDLFMDNQWDEFFLRPI